MRKTIQYYDNNQNFENISLKSVKNINDQSISTEEKLKKNNGL